MQLKQLLKQQEGVTAIEFAVVAPTLMLLIMGSIEMMMLMYAQSVLEGASFAASRTGKTGYTATDQTREETIINTLNNYAGVLMDTNNITITSTAYTEFDDVGDPEPFVDANGNGIRDTGENYTDVNENGQYDTDVGLSGVGGASEVVVYTITYPWQISTPLIGTYFGNNGLVTLSARAVVQNEPF